MDISRKNINKTISNIKKIADGLEEWLQTNYDTYKHNNIEPLLKRNYTPIFGPQLEKLDKICDCLEERSLPYPNTHHIIRQKVLKIENLLSEIDQRIVKNDYRLARRKVDSLAHLIWRLVEKLRDTESALKESSQEKYIKVKTNIENSSQVKTINDSTHFLLKIAEKVDGLVNKPGYIGIFQKQTKAFCDQLNEAYSEQESKIEAVYKKIEAARLQLESMYEPKTMDQSLFESLIDLLSLPSDYRTEMLVDDIPEVHIIPEETKSQADYFTLAIIHDKRLRDPRVREIVKDVWLKDEDWINVVWDDIKKRATTEDGQVSVQCTYERVKAELEKVETKTDRDKSVTGRGESERDKAKTGDLRKRPPGELMRQVKELMRTEKNSKKITEMLNKNYVGTYFVITHSAVRGAISRLKKKKLPKKRK